MTDPPVPINVWVKYRSAKPSFGRKSRIIVLHVQVEEEDAFGVVALWGSLHDYFPESHVALAHKHLVIGMRVSCNVLNLREKSCRSRIGGFGCSGRGFGFGFDFMLD